MSLKKHFEIVGCAALSAALTVAVPCVYAQEEAEEAAPAAAPQIDPALETEIKFAEALVDAGLPDFARPVIAAAKETWKGPEADTRFFAIEVRADLSLGEFDAAEKKIASLPDRNGPKYWAARLEVANNYNSQGKKKECSAIYEEFFKKYPKPPPELRSFYIQASYAYGQILMADKRLLDAAKRYDGLLELLNPKSAEDAENWASVACETAETYLRIASGIEKIKDRTPHLDAARKYISKLLWMQDKPVYFGRAIAMKANLELLKGDVAKAQATIDDYMEQLAELHNSIKEVDPDGKFGLLRLSPMPLCRYMLAEILWNETQEEFKKTPRDDDKIKALMFGQIVSGKKRNGQGAFNHSINVFVQYPESAYAAKAGEMNEAIRAFAEKNYGAKIKSNVTPEQMENVRRMQFMGGFEKMGEGDWEGAIAEFNTALAGFPEGKLSVQAVAGLVNCYGQLLMRKKDDPKAADWRIDLDAIEGYLAERFAGNPDNAIMSLAGEEAMRAANAEKARGEIARADAIQKAYLMNYRRHVQAPIIAANLAGTAQKEEKWDDAIALWELFAKYYPKSPFAATAYASLGYCYDKVGNRDKAIEAYTTYIGMEKDNILRRTQTQMQLAILRQKAGKDIIDGAETNAAPEAVASQIALGNKQIILGIKEFRDFAKVCDERLADPGESADNKAKYKSLKENALYLEGVCWSQLTKPADKLEGFRKQAAAGLENYLKAFPQGQYAIRSYVMLGSLYTALGDMERSKNALDRLTQSFPDAPETKDAKPRLAKNLIDMGFVREGASIYAEMLRLDGNYTAQQFLRAGEALIDARNWELANQAFEKAVAKAGTNSWTTVAKARIGQARSLYKQKAYVEAREAIDQILENDRLKKTAAAAEANLLLVDVASEQGKTEKNDAARGRHFGAAMGALKKVRGYWANKPQWEQDKTYIMSAEVQIRRMEAEDAMGLKDKALETCEKAAANLQSFLQSRMPDADHPLSEMNAQQTELLERGYAMIVPLFAKLGPDKGEFVLKFGQEYMDMFPNGKSRTEVQNCINAAKAAGAVLTEATRAAVDANAAQADADEPAEQVQIEEEAAEEAPAEAEPPAPEAPEAPEAGPVPGASAPGEAPAAAE